MSTAIAIGASTLQLPDPGESYSLPLINQNNTNVAAEVNKLVANVTFVSVITTDTNWSYDGGIYVQTDAAGRKLAHLTVRLTRIAGGSVALTATEIQAMTQLVPNSALPRGFSVRRPTIIQSSAGAVIWGLVTRIDPTGKLFLATDSGNASIALTNQFELDAWWVI